MVQLKILSGKKAGTEWSARHFPFTVGRASSDDLQIDDAGIWEKHFEISSKLPDGFILHAKNESPVAIDGKSTPEAILKNGDTIEIGATKIQFRLSPVKQKNLLGTEIAIWITLAIIFISQSTLLYWLLTS